MPSTRVVVVGAGIIGLTTAVRLAENGFEVAVVARDLPLETTSAVAAALWYPYRAFPRVQVLTWATTTFEQYLADLLDTESGVRLVDGLELRNAPGDPWFVDALPEVAGFDRVTDLPDGYADGWQLRLPVIEPAIYLQRLVTRLESLGGTVTRLALSALPDDVLVVNCSGLAARSLAKDLSVEPVRGQVVRLTRPAGVDGWLLDQSDETHPVYVVPRSSDVIVGGSAEADVFDQQPDHKRGLDMVDRAARFFPALADAKVLGMSVGLRPMRPSVRFGFDELVGNNGRRQVFHNYGHGGAGWTTAWGCADQVVAALDALSRPTG